MQHVRFPFRLIRQHPCLSIFLIALILRLCSALLLRLCQNLQGEPFDSSHLLLHGVHDDVSNTAVIRATLSTATLRWDAIHFASIARDGYVWERQLAFQPGWPVILRQACRAGRAARAAYYGLGLGSKVSVEAAVDWKNSPLGVEEIVPVGEVLASVSYAGAAVMLFKLTKRLSTSFHALIATTFYLLPPSPAVMSSPYGEPLFALLVFSGYYLCIQRKFWLASVVLAIATSIRATGVVNAGVIAWYGIFGQSDSWEVMKRPLIVIHRAIAVAIPAIIVVGPFVLTQAYWYLRVCHATDSQAPAWCQTRIPLVYSAVQKTYWNVGLFNYWTPAQLPNMLIASPILGVSFHGAYRFFTRAVLSSAHATSTAIPYTAHTSALIPFYIVHLVLTLLLTFSAHSQIALRLSVTDPVIWWTVAALAIRRSEQGSGQKTMETKNDGSVRSRMVLTRFGKVWVSWVVVYGAISTPLWAGHYPPA